MERAFTRPGGQAQRALGGVSLRIGSGERVAVLGKSGSGKSTLLNLVAGLDRATAGQVRVADEPTGNLDSDTDSLRIQARMGPGQALEPLARQLDQLLIQARQVPRQIISREAVRDSLDEHFKVVGDVIRMVALAAALVGGVWLAASSSLNVLEGSREIGVLRALGPPQAALC